MYKSNKSLEHEVYSQCAKNYKRKDKLLKPPDRVRKRLFKISGFTCVINRIGWKKMLNNSLLKEKDLKSKWLRWESKIWINKSLFKYIEKSVSQLCCGESRKWSVYPLKWKESEIALLCPTLCNLVDCM